MRLNVNSTESGLEVEVSDFDEYGSIERDYISWETIAKMIAPHLKKHMKEETNEKV